MQDRYTDRNVNFEKTYTYFVQAIYVQDETLLDEVISNRQTVTIEKHEEPQNILNGKSTSLPQQKTPDFDNMDGHEFENFCANSIKTKWFQKRTVTKGSGASGYRCTCHKGWYKIWNTV